MTSSMTAFCRTQINESAGQLIWEIRSVNHRYLDVHLKLPEELRSLETKCRDLMGKALNRGRIDAALKFEASEQSDNALAINQSTLDTLANAISHVHQQLPDTTSASSMDILRWPGVLQKPVVNTDQLAQLAEVALKDALKELVDNRLREGARMAQLIQERISAAREIVSTLRGDLPQIEADMKQRWQRRLDELETEVDPARLAQELAVLLTRNDVSEELDRLDTHYDEVERVLQDSKPAGRRLDFLMQELNREANTLGSKSVDLRNTNAAVELKVLIDQMREQVQNIE